MNLIEIVVAALHQNVRQQLSDQTARRYIIEDCHVINGPQSRQYFSPLSLAEHRSIRPLQFTHSAIAVYRHNECVAERARLRQIAHMPDVQQVKHTIRKHEPLAQSAQTLALGEQRPPGQNLFDH